MTCPRCHRPLADDARFCPGCGLDRAWAPEPPPAGREPVIAPTGDQDADRPVRRRRRWVVPAVAAGALLVVGGVAGAVVLLSAGGASSPEEAVNALVEAVSAEDPVGAVATLQPDEAGQLIEVWSAAADQAQALDLDPDAGRDTFLSGFDVSIADLTTQTDMLAEGVARVELTAGVLRWDVDSGAMGEGLRGYVERYQAGPWSTDGSASVDDLASAGLPTFLVVVDDGDGWYVSPAYTAAQYWVEANGLPGGDFARRGEPSQSRTAASTAEAAVTSVVDTLSQQGPVPAVQQLTDQAGGVFAVYQDALVSALLDDPQLDLGSLAVDVQLLTRVRELEDDDRAVVTVSRVDGYASTADDGYDIAFDAACPTDDAEACFGDLGALFSVQDLHVVVAERDDDQWVVDPYATLWSYAVEAARGFDEERFLTTLADAGLEDIVPPAGELTVGQPLTMTLNPAGYATASLAMTAGQTYVLYSGDGAQVYADDPAYDTTWGYGVDEQDAVVPVVATGDPGSTITVTADLLSVADVALDQETTGTLATGQCAVVRTELFDGELVEARATDAAGDALSVAHGGVASYYYSSDEGFDVLGADDTGSAEVGVCNYDEDPLDFALTIASYEEEPYVYPTSVTVDGMSSVDGYVSDGDSPFHEIVVPAYSSAVVTVYPESDLDVVLTVFSGGDGEEQFDSYYEGDAESFVVPYEVFDQYLSVRIDIYGTSPARAGSYTITAT